MRTAPEQDLRITDAVEREGSRLRAFLRRRVPDPNDVEDVLQDVFCELVEANRLLMPIEHVGAWLYRVARNRVIDRLRRKRAVPVPAPPDEPERLRLEELLPPSDSGPETLYERGEVLAALERAIEELPRAQREVFVAHELEGRRFEEMAAETGVSVNTLLSRKRYAVLRLRKKLRVVYEEIGRR